MKRMSLRWRVLIPVVAAIFLLAGAIFLVSQYLIVDQAETMALNKVRSDLALMYELIDSRLPGPWRGEGEGLYKGTELLNNNKELVDWLAGLTGNTVTVFRGGTRIATTVVSQGQRAVGTEAAQNVIDQVLRDKKPYYGKADVAGNLYQTAYRPLLDEQGEAVGMLYTGASPKIIDQTVSAFRGTVFLISVIFSVLLVLMLYVLLSRGVLRPMARAAQHAARIAEGDLTEEISQKELARGDEIGVLAQAFQELRDSLRGIINALQEMTEQASTTGQNLLAASEENSATLEEVASALGEFSEMISAVREQSDRMAHSAQSVTELVGSGQRDMERTVQSMERIVQSSKQTEEAVALVSEAAQGMGLVLEMISDVAEQTNLLALNAAIEAARAGEQGRGFAVVAEEVRKLAEKTQDSVSKIAGMNNSLLSQVARAVESINATEAEVAQGQQALAETNSNFAQVFSQINEMVERINGVAHSSGTMDETSQSLAAAAQEQAASMTELATMAETVASMVDELQAVIAQFRL